MMYFVVLMEYMCKMLTEKYRPQSLEDVIQQNAIKKLDAWLSEWVPTTKHRAVLLSGPPGIGKTTVALCLAKKYNLNPIEINASDTRNAAAIRDIFVVQTANTIYIIDEVDGMSISDKGGIAELGRAIEKTRVPVICICNDRQSTQARALVKHCLDIHFESISPDLITKRLTDIARIEKLPTTHIKSIVMASAGDMRLALNSLQMQHSSHIDSELRMDAFTATQALFKRAGDLDSAEKLMFVDYELGPLIAQQYYAERETDISRVSQAADMFSIMDVYSDKIHREQAWGLLPYIPTLSAGAVRKTRGQLPHWLQFPAVLAKGSSQRAKAKYLTDIASRTKIPSRHVLRMDYFDMLRIHSLGQLAKPNCSINDVIDSMVELGLTRDDIFDVLAEMGFDSPPTIPTKTKTAFTRAYNKRFTSTTKPVSTESDEEDL